MNILAPLTRCDPPLQNEAQRLALLHSMELLDSPVETAFDAITQLAAQVTGRPIALIGLVDADRTWFKSRVGLDAAQSPRDISFCNAAITSDDIFEVPDAWADPRFEDNPLVTGAPHVRFYAGMPLRVAGLAMGTVCVVDHTPHRLDAPQRNALRQLAHLTVELMERRLASRAKTEFIGHLNHEMRTPMNAILGFGQILELKMAPESREAGHVRHILDAGQHLLELIDESLDLMRVEAGAVSLDMRSIDLVPVLTEVAELVRPMADTRRIALELQLPARVCVQGDTRRVKQVLLNLASNAIKYSREGSSITLTTDNSDESGPWAAVQDSGRGMTAEQLGRLFKPFERLGQERGTVEGTGLGLALSARLIEAMGARIDVTSEVGRGTQFTVRWQRCDDDHTLGAVRIAAGAR
jgi:signal transduction histidine kinase